MKEEIPFKKTSFVDGCILLTMAVVGVAVGSVIRFALSFLVFSLLAAGIAWLCGAEDPRSVAMGAGCLLAGLWTFGVVVVAFSKAFHNRGNNG